VRIKFPPILPCKIFLREWTFNFLVMARKNWLIYHDNAIEIEQKMDDSNLSRSEFMQRDNKFTDVQKGYQTVNS
jgi:hypothetical protein